jgi:uncharacterized membrane protein YphA (DoxX/SURF4 family)
MKTRSRILVIAARTVLGLVFLVSGANKLLHFMPMPPMPAAAGGFVGAMAATGYLIPLLALTEIVGGALLLAGRLVPFALVLLAPVVVNVVAFHLFLAPAGLAVPVVLLAAELYLAWVNRGAFAPMFTARSRQPALAPPLRQAA